MLVRRFLRASLPGGSHWDFPPWSSLKPPKAAKRAISRRREPIVASRGGSERRWLSSANDHRSLLQGSGSDRRVLRHRRGHGARLRPGRGSGLAGGASRRSDRGSRPADHRGGGARAIAIPTDVGDESQARAFVERTHSELGRLDVLVNNAGVMLLGPIENAPTEEWRRMIEANVFGVLYCTHAALGLMREQGSGHIVNVSSVAGRVARAGSGVYNLTKFGVGAFSESLRQEGVAIGVRVTTIEPGAVATELPGHNRPEVLEQM